MTVRAERGAESHLLDDVRVEIRVPSDFPEKYDDAIVRAAGQCLIKAQLGQKPAIETAVVQGLLPVLDDSAPPTTEGEPSRAHHR